MVAILAFAGASIGAIYLTWRSYQSRLQHQISSLKQARNKARTDGISLADKVLSHSGQMLDVREYLGEGRKNHDSMNLTKIEKALSRNRRSKSDIQVQIDARRSAMRRFVDLGGVRQKNGLYEVARTAQLNPDKKQFFMSHVHSVNMFLEEAHSKLNGLERDDKKLNILRSEVGATSTKTPQEIVERHGLPEDPLYARRPQQKVPDKVESTVKKDPSESVQPEKKKMHSGMKKGKKKKPDPLQGLGFDADVPPFGPLQDTRLPAQYLEAARREGLRTRGISTENKNAPRSGK